MTKSQLIPLTFTGKKDKEQRYLFQNNGNRIQQIQECETWQKKMNLFSSY